MTCLSKLRECKLRALGFEDIAGLRVVSGLRGPSQGEAVGTFCWVFGGRISGKSTTFHGSGLNLPKEELEAGGLAGLAGM